MRFAWTTFLAVCWMGGSAFGQVRTATVPEEIFYNGKIVTVDSSFRIEQAFAVRGEEILAVGASAAVRALAGPNARLTDLRGHTVIPGLMDNHNHQFNAAWNQYRGVDTAGVQSKQELLDRLRQAVAVAVVDKMREKHPVPVDLFETAQGIVDVMKDVVIHRERGPRRVADGLLLLHDPPQPVALVEGPVEEPVERPARLRGGELPEPVVGLLGRNASQSRRVFQARGSVPGDYERPGAGDEAVRRIAR